MDEVCFLLLFCILSEVRAESLPLYATASLRLNLDLDWKI